MYKVLYDISFNPTLLLFLLSFFLLLFSFIFIFLLKRKRKGKRQKNLHILHLDYYHSSEICKAVFISLPVTPSLGVTPMVVCLPVSCAIADVEQR